MPRDLIRLLLDYSSLKKEQWKSSETLQAGRLARLLDSARRTRHYADMLPPPGHPPDFSSIRQTAKEDIVSCPERFLTVPASSLWPARTSGSTGLHTTVYLDEKTLVQRTAYRLFIESEFGRSPSDLAVQIHSSPHPPSFLSRFGLFRKEYLSVFDDDLKNLEKIAASGARVLGTYASTMSMLASLNGQLENPLRLKLAFCYGDMLNQETREYIEDSFSCPVFQFYGSTEFGPIAFECPEERKLHVNSGSFILELVDSKGRPARTGNILVTSLINHAMPLIRYRIGDVASWGSCSCGRAWPVLESIQGREDDYLVLPSGTVRSAMALFGLYKVPHLKAYQIVQEKPDLFVFKYVPRPPGFPESSKSIVSEKIKSGCLGEDVEVVFLEVDDLPKGSTGKLRQFISKVKR